MSGHREGRGVCVMFPEILQRQERVWQGGKRPATGLVKISSESSVDHGTGIPRDCPLGLLWQGWQDSWAVFKKLTEPDRKMPRFLS